MRNWLKRLIAPVAAVVAFGLVSMAAKADTVTYTAHGFFTAGGTATVDGGNNQILDVGANQLTFVDETNTMTLNPLFFPLGTHITADFGHFIVTGGGSPAAFTGAHIHLDITQTFPGSGTGAFVGGVDGSVGLNNGVLTVKFDAPLQQIIPNVGTYPPDVLYGIDQTQSLDTLSLQNEELRGFVAAAPLPTTASVGLCLLGGLGAWMLTGRRSATRAAL
jgi:hypothetical protein